MFYKVQIFSFASDMLPEIFWLFSKSPQTPENSGAEERNRTSGLLITNQLLYQLSYFSTKMKSSQYLEGRQ